MSIPSIVSAGRRHLATAFLDRCIIADRTQVRDTRGGWRAEWADRSTPTECWFTALTDESPKIPEDTGQMFGVPTAQVQFPLGTKIGEGDRITNLNDSSMWIVTSFLTPASQISVSTRVGIRRVDKGETG